MEYLRRFAEEYELEKVVEGLAERSDVQGAVLTLDEWWLIAWRYEEQGRTDEWERWLHSMWRLRDPGIALPVVAPSLGITAKPWIPLRPPKLSWRPAYWDQLCYMTGRHDMDAPPVRLVVCLLPPKGGEEATVPELPRFRLPVSFEVRPAALLSTGHRGKARPIVGGVSVGAGPSLYGTLGGILEDDDGARYGMTCSHVFHAATSVQQPARHDDAQATSIGVSAASIGLQQCLSAGPCNPYTISPHITDVDTTLVELQSGIPSDLEILSLGPVAGVVAKNAMTPGQEVIFVGRTSGSRIAEVGGLALFYRLRRGAKTYCFRDLFEIRWGSFIRALLGPVVQAGDSGAWVCAETAAGPGWCGQVIGEDRHVGYAAFAENTLAAWSRIGKHLHVA